MDFCSHFGCILPSFSILFACLFFASMLHRFWIDFLSFFACRKPKILFVFKELRGFSPFSKRYQKSLILASILASFRHHFSIVFRYFFGLNFWMPFWIHFFWLLLKNGSQNGRSWNPGCRPLGAPGLPQNVPKTHPRRNLDFPLILGAVLLIFLWFWLQKSSIWLSFDSLSAAVGSFLVPFGSLLVPKNVSKTF